MSKVEEFLKMYQGKGTYAVYRWAIGEFFKTVQVDSDQYFTTERNYEEDLKSFLQSLNGSPPKTVRLKISVVKSFLIENGVEFQERFWRRINKNIQGHRALTLDKVPSNEELRRIISHTQIHGKALFLMLSSSGMRIGEALALDKDDDIDFKTSPATVKINGATSKTGESRITFISREAVEAIQEWMKVRSEYLKSAVLKSKERPQYKVKFLGKNPNDNRLFPFDVSTAHYIWTHAVEKAGYLKKDKQTNRNTLHIHVLRKFFRSKMATLIPVDITEALMGHEGYLTEVYRRYSNEQLAEFYLKGEMSVLVFGTGTQDLTELRKDFSKAMTVVSQDLETKNRTLEERVGTLTVEVDNLKNGLATTKDTLDTLIKVIEKEQVGEFKEWLNSKRKADFEQADNEQKTKILKGE